MIIANQSISLLRPLGTDKYGEPLGNETFTMAARVTNEINKVQNPAGEEVISNLLVLIRLTDLTLSGTEKVLYSDKVQFTDEFGNVTERVPQNISLTPGFGGKSFFVRVYV